MLPIVDEQQQTQQLKYRCRGKYCDYQADRVWRGNCPGCGRFYNCIFNRKASSEDFQSRISIAALMEGADDTGVEHIPTGVPGFDRVLNGGLVRGSSIRISGPPGCGKSTLLFTVANSLASGSRSTVLYASGEEGKSSLRGLVRRLGLKNKFVDVLCNQGDVDAIIEEAEDRKPLLLIVDSLQNAFIEDLGGNFGSAEQVKAVTQYLGRFCKRENLCLILVSHVNRAGDAAGPRTVQHDVDTVLELEFCDRDGTITIDTVGPYRKLIVGKNRDGPSNLTAMFEVQDDGTGRLEEIEPMMSEKKNWKKKW